MTGQQLGLAVFRADASQDIGSGHVRRCLALASALNTEGWQCAFAVRPGSQATVPELSAGEATVLELAGHAIDEPKMLAARWPNGVDLLIVDHYGRDAGFETACRGWAKRVFAIDDLAGRAHDADFLLDQGLGRVPEAYAGRVPGQCRLLLGTSYALLRPRFSAIRLGEAAKEAAAMSRIVISLGGGDSKDVVGVICAGVVQCGLPLTVDILMGASAASQAGAQEFRPGDGQQFRVHVDYPDPAGLIAGADLAIGAGGTSAWERCCLGVPTLLILLADNQRDNAAALIAAGAAQSLGDAGSLTASAVAAALRALSDEPDRRRAMAQAAGRLCDGLGARRVAMELDLPRARDGEPVRLRPARRDDGELMLAWQSQPGARRFSRSPHAPQREAHFAWFEQKLSERSCVFNIVMHGETPAGVLRLDRQADMGFQISILIDASHQRLGLARAALLLARRLMPDVLLLAEVLPGNEGSAALFRDAGYRRTDGRWLVHQPLARAPHRRAGVS